MRFIVLLDTLVSVANLLNDMPLDRANRRCLHPIHQDTYKTLVSLIANLRQCRSFEDFHHFQQTLLEEILKIQGHGQACAWVAKRLRKGRTLPADAPELRSGEDIHDPESWELEADVCERVERQLRSIADAEPVKLDETSGDLNYLCGLLGLDRRAGLVDPYFAGQGGG